MSILSKLIDCRKKEQEKKYGLVMEKSIAECSCLKEKCCELDSEHSKLAKECNKIAEVLRHRFAK